MVRFASDRCGTWWFGVAWEDTDLVAAARASTMEEALRAVAACIPKGVASHLESSSSAFFSGVVAMLGELERGNEEHKQFSLSKAYLSESLRRVLIVAAAIPIGYVSSYGNIAKAAGSEARVVGRIMATNPLYPIVPCHRVVGADLSLVGYGGRRDRQALSAKLARIKAEARGASSQKDIPVFDESLTVYPAERVIEAARAEEKRRREAARRRAEREAADRLQLRLF
jgi:methylated-DNA-[protein]-cysteine S-methyltransferase